MVNKMNFRRIFTIVKRDMKKLVREPATLFLVILFPIVLTLALGVSFGAIGGNEVTTYNLGVVDENAVGIYEHWSQDFIGNLSESELLEIHVYSSAEKAQDDLSIGELSAVLIIPQNFGESCESFITNPMNQSLWMNTTLGLYIDKASMVADQVVPPLTQQALIKTLMGEQALSATIPVDISSPSLTETESETVFDYMAPGIFAFGAIFLIMTVAQSLSIDKEEGLLRRINTTPLTSSEFISSQTLSNMVMALMQVSIIFIMAFAVGYSPDTGIAGIAMAFIIVLVFALCCVGFGLIAATLAKSSGAATGISFIFIMPMMFLGTFVTSSAPSAASEAAGKAVPSFYVTDALTQLFLRGASPTSSAVITDLVIVSIFSIVILLIGIVLFKKFGNK